MKNFFLGFLFLFMCSTIAYSQQSERDKVLSKQFTFSYKEISVSQLLDTIKKEYDFDLFYSSTSLDLTERISVNYRNITIGELFDKLFFKTRIQFVIVKDRIVLQHFDGKLYQNIRGKLIDAETKEPLMFAAVAVTSTDPQMGTVTDLDGNFVIYDVPIGRHKIQTSMLSYAPLMKEQVMVKSAKETYLELEMNEMATKMDEVVIEARKDITKSVNSMGISSVKKFDSEETQRYAAGMADPGRMAQSFASTMPAETGLMNEVSIRGHSPKSLDWRLEGLDIHSPGHIKLQGSTGGVLSMLNSSMMASSDFYTGVLPAEYGNATSGVFDIKMRKGNSTKREHEFKNGLLGTEFASEGYIVKGKRGSYLFNVRYFDGTLLSEVVDFGFNVVPSWYDFSYKIVLPTKRFGQFSLFGINGDSKSIQSPPATTDDYFGKTDILNGSMSFINRANGIKHNLIISDKLYVQTTIGYVYDVEYLDLNYQNVNLDYRNFSNFYGHFINENIDFNSYLNYNWNKKNSLRIGVNQSWIAYDFYSGFDITHKAEYPYEVFVFDDVLFDDVGTTRNTQFYFQNKYSLSQKVKISYGLNLMEYTFANDRAIDPRFNLHYKPSNKTNWNLAIGRHSKSDDLSSALTRGGGVARLRNLGLTHTDQVVLGMDHKLDRWLFKGEVYYHYGSNIGIAREGANLFSMHNVTHHVPTLITYRFYDMVSEGNSINRGFEFSLEKSFSDNYYVLTSVSSMQSYFSDIEGNWHESLYHHDYIFKMSTGKEWTLGKNKEKVLGLNMRGMFADGMRYPFIRAYEKSANLVDRYDETAQSFGVGDNMFQIDLGMNYIINRKRVTHEVRLDFYNALNSQFKIGEEYNPVTDEIVPIVNQPIWPGFTYSLKW